jgi:hypothetical protein
MAAREDAAMPLPREETTPPVIKMNFVMEENLRALSDVNRLKVRYFSSFQSKAGIFCKEFIKIK